jgi:hypothetical protein
MSLSLEFQKTQNEQISILANFFSISCKSTRHCKEEDGLTLYLPLMINYELACLRHDKDFRPEKSNLLSTFKRVFSSDDKKAALDENAIRHKNNYSHRDTDPSMAGRSYEALLNIATKKHSLQCNNMPTYIWATESCGGASRANFSWGTGPCKVKRGTINSILSNLTCVTTPGTYI